MPRFKNCLKILKCPLIWWFLGIFRNTVFIVFTVFYCFTMNVIFLLQFFINFNLKILTLPNYIKNNFLLKFQNFPYIKISKFSIFPWIENLNFYFKKGWTSHTSFSYIYECKTKFLTFLAFCKGIFMSIIHVKYFG